MLISKRQNKEGKKIPDMRLNIRDLGFLKPCDYEYVNQAINIIVFCFTIYWL